MHFLSLLVALALFVQPCMPWCAQTHFAQTAQINELAVSPDGSMVVTSSSSNLATVWDYPSMNPIFVYNLTHTVQTAKWSKDGAWLAVGGVTNNVVIFSVANRVFTSNKTITTTHGQVNQLDFSYETGTAMRLMTCGNDSKASFWNVSNAYSSIQSVSIPGSRIVMTCKFAKNNFIGVGLTNGTITYYNPGYSQNWTSNIGSTVWSLDIEATSTYLIAACNDGKVYRYLTASGTANGTQTTGNSQLYSVAFNANAYQYASIGSNGILLVTNLSNSAVTFNITQVASAFYASVFTGDSRYLLTANTNGITYTYKKMCEDCPQGMYEGSGGVCRMCSMDQPGCQACQNSLSCFSCKNGYYLTNTSLCALCQSTITGCFQCNSSTVCSSCLPTYYLSTNNCTLCSVTLTHCLTCSSSNLCTYCDRSYYWNTSSLICDACINLKRSCLVCSNNSANGCLDCLDGYYLSAGACTPCGNNCTHCLNSSYCTQCVSSFYLNVNNTCTVCVSPCLSCYNASYCVSCDDNYFLNSSNLCSPCQQPCYKCATSSSNCQSCVAGYYSTTTTPYCTACSFPCVTCSSSSLCLSCLVGYYYLAANNSCNTCQTLKANCRECTNVTCLLCQGRFYWSSGSNACVSCSKGCDACSSNLVCELCSAGYYYSSGSCIACGTGCTACISNSSCSSCLPSYYLSTTSCVPCQSPCLTCSSSACFSCSPSTFLNSSSLCQSCSMANCIQCTNQSTCTACALGYYISGGSCTQCTQPCSSCNATTCLVCPVSYYLVNTTLPYTCSVCPFACTTCNSSTACHSCTVGYYLAVNLTCIHCQSITAGCQTCTIGLCLSCSSVMGYYYNGSTCLNCSSIGCLQCSDNSTCSKCNLGYYLNGSTCVMCSQSSCASCSNSTNCLSCLSPYYLSISNATCILCSQGCFTCTSSTVCLQCQQKYTLVSTVCQYCQAVYTGCDICNGNGCLECMGGYFINGSTCVGCQNAMQGCHYCSNASICLDCLDSYYINAGACSMCSNSMIGCFLCINSSLCKQCLSGYLLTGSGTCSSCSAGCLSCNSSSVCSVCSSGMYLDANYSCSACSSLYPGCIHCNSTSCALCQSGYYQSNGSCLACAVVGCQICSTANTCLSCNSQYYLNATTCTQCRSQMTGCLLCSNSSTCQSCQNGYYLNSSACIGCSSLFVGCSICSPFQCLSCYSGYLLNVSSSACTPCLSYLPGCSLCTSTTVCSLCQSGFYLNGTACSRCNGITGCLLCSNATTCLICDNQYYLDNGTCTKCSTGILGCIQCSSAAICDLCIGNYSLAQGNCTLMVGSGSTPYQELSFYSQYANASVLKHVLLTSTSFSSSSMDLSTQTKLSIRTATLTSINLTILSYEQGSTSITFYTDNPLNLSSDSSLFKSMEVVRLLSVYDHHLYDHHHRLLSDHHPRLLGSNLQLQGQFVLAMSQAGIQSILPSSDHMGSLQMSYSMQDPSFFMSIAQLHHYPYALIGIIITIILFLHYLIKSVVTTPTSPNKGEIMAHILSIKCVALAIYPSYYELVVFCQGWMTADLPWLNAVIGELIGGGKIDQSIGAWRIFYNGRDLGNTYPLALLIIIISTLILSIIYFIRRDQLTINLAWFIFNFMGFGLSFACFLSTQLIFNVQPTSFTFSSVLSVLGVIIILLMLAFSVYQIIVNHNLSPCRMIIKSFLCSLLPINPLPIVSATIAMDAILSIMQYFLMDEARIGRKGWLLQQYICNGALLWMIVMPDMLLSIVMATVGVCVVASVDGYLHYLEYTHSQELAKLSDILALAKTLSENESIKKSARMRNDKLYLQSKTQNLIDDTLIIDDDPFHEEVEKKEFTLDHLMGQESIDSLAQGDLWNVERGRRRNKEGLRGGNDGNGTTVTTGFWRSGKFNQWKIKLVQDQKEEHNNDKDGNKDKDRDDKNTTWNTKQNSTGVSYPKRAPTVSTFELSELVRTFHDFQSNP